MANSFERAGQNNAYRKSSESGEGQLYHCQACGAFFRLNGTPKCCNKCGQKFGSFKPERMPLDNDGTPKTIEQQRKEEFLALPENVRKAYSILGKRKWELDQDPDPLGTIKRQWREQAKGFHSDINEEDDEAMKEINVARDKLNEIYKNKSIG